MLGGQRTQFGIPAGVVLGVNGELLPESTLSSAMSEISSRALVWHLSTVWSSVNTA